MGYIVHAASAQADGGDINMILSFARQLKRRVSAWWTQSVQKCRARSAFRYDWRQFAAHAGALHPDRKAAARSEIVMGYHVLEKGLTMPRRRLGFGKGAVAHLMNLVASFERRFGDDPQVRHAVGVLRAYAELHRGLPDQVPGLDAFLAARQDIPAAIEPHVTCKDFFAAKDAPFPVFAASRHVVRHFARPVPRETLEEAFAIAATAPSACNRQPARIHVIDDPALRDALFAIQGGTRGFGSDADKVLVVTADLSTIRWGWERHDAYTNGGIFVMNLCYALHYCGVVHCILHWSVPPADDRKAHSLLGIPENEVIVQVIACGLPPDEFDVPASPRLPPEALVTWHGGAK